MPLYLTAAHSSRVQKSAAASASRRPSASTSSSLWASARRSKAVPRSKSQADAREDEAAQDEAPLDATGQIRNTLAVASATDVISAVRHSTTTMFCPLPDRAGMNSTRIAEVLNLQRNLPPVVSLAHVHALISASSRTEREIAALMAAGRLRKLKVAGRGNDISGTSEMLILIDQLEQLLHASHVAPDAVSAFLLALRRHPKASALPSNILAGPHLTALTRAGFLVSSSLSGTRNLSLTGSALVAMPSISRAASGSCAAVGGDAAFEHLGGVGAAKRSNSEPQISHAADLALSVPNIGPYLRLLHAGRNHLLGLLGKSKYREAPVYLLRERWDGAIDSESRTSTAKRIRGEFSTVLPARTKKWKDLQGLSFDWVLEECLGAGLVEVFETHSVGLGVRALS